MAKKKVRLFIDTGARLKQYFLRGHSQWFALLFSLIMFTLIVNNLLIKNLHFVPDELKSYTVFVTIFAIIYFPVATILGYLDFRKGTFAAEQILHQQLSPIWRDVFARLEKLEEGNKEVLAKLEKLS